MNLRTLATQLTRQPDHEDPNPFQPQTDLDDDALSCLDPIYDDSPEPADSTSTATFLSLRMMDLASLPVRRAATNTLIQARVTTTSAKDASIILT